MSLAHISYPSGAGSGLLVPFPVGTSLNDVRIAFNFAGGFLKTLDTQPESFLVLPDQTISSQNYELVIVGPGYAPEVPNDCEKVEAVNPFSEVVFELNTPSPEAEVTKPPPVPNRLNLGALPGRPSNWVNSSNADRPLSPNRSLSPTRKSRLQSSGATIAGPLVDKAPTPLPPQAQKISAKRMTLVPSLQDYEQELASEDIQKRSGDVSLSDALRCLVSKKKKRFVTSKYNLDLAYITDRIIAMGFPAANVESLYRNSRKDVVSFLESTHPDKYKVWNLCKEATYQYDSSVFHGRVSNIPFYDHNPPGLSQMYMFCVEASEWLDKDEDNVIVVHCKAGKGRTGLMICALLCYRYRDKGLDAQAAMDFYSLRRTEDCKGVTIPSQKRFIVYFDQIIRRPDPTNFLSTLTRSIQRLSSLTFSTSPKFGSDRCWRISFGTCAEEYIIDSHSTNHQRSDQGGRIYFTNMDVLLKGEVKVELFASKEIGKEQFCYCWFHCVFVQADCLEFGLRDLDGKAKSKKFQSHFGDDFKLILYFSESTSR